VFINILFIFNSGQYFDLTCLKNSRCLQKRERTRESVCVRARACARTQNLAECELCLYSMTLHTV
jgi:hypothetical protein